MMRRDLPVRTAVTMDTDFMAFIQGEEAFEPCSWSEIP